jgi:hypothetical protein
MVGFQGTDASAGLDLTSHASMAAQDRDLLGGRGVPDAGGLVI